MVHDRWTDRQAEKQHIEVGAPPKKELKYLNI